MQPSKAVRNGSTLATRRDEVRETVVLRRNLKGELTAGRQSVVRRRTSAS